MKWFDDYRIRFVIAGIVVAIVLGDGRSANADFTFGEPTNLGATVNSSSRDGSPNLSSDGLELFFDSTRPGGSGDYDVWVAMRATTDGNWEAPSNLGHSINSPSFDGQPEISADGLSLFFISDRSGGQGNVDIWITTRATQNDTWAKPVNLGSIVNSPSADWSPSITTDGLSLFFCSNRSGGVGGWDVWVTTRAGREDPWGQPVNLGPTVNSSAGEAYVDVSADGLALFLSELGAPFRAGGFGGGDLWVTTRANNSDPWGSPVNLGPTVNTGAWDVSSDVSANGSNLYFTSERPGGLGGIDSWQAPVLPIVDLNGDGIVDAADMCIMVDYWGTDEPLCDVGPMPWGDGIVDVQDLKVLADHLFTYPGAVAYWMLDETEGMLAYDSACENDAEVMGGAVWQPTEGVVDGALLLDGVDDYVLTECARDPSEGSFSVFAWVKGGVPGQVLVSQAMGANWLMADASSGHLMTELKKSGRSGKFLLSETVITDGSWHRVGVVWDGTNIILYVDDVAVAADTQSAMVGSNGGLNIGCGKNLEPGSFWSGLVDDVLIYNRAVEP